jgi:phosphonate transport system permease protein
MTAPVADLRQSFLDQRAVMEARHGELFATNWRRRITVVCVIGALLGLYIYGLIEFEFSPSRIVGGMWRLVDITSLMLPPNPGSWDRFWLFLGALGQTLSIAFLGTLLAAIMAVPVGFLAAKNIVASRVLHFLTRRGLDTIRSVDTLVWALIWIDVVGLGPFAGALAIASSDFGALGKLMSEAIETADRKAGEGVLSTGGSRLHSIRFGIVPQVLPVFASQMLYFFESNTRSATIIGIVGAGGIGLYLSEQIRVLEWRQVSFLIVMILVTVAAIDAISQRLRAAIMGRRRG